MGLSWFCTHEKYDVLSWKYINIGKPDQKIEATIRCKNCEKIVKKIIDGDRINAFAVVYDDKYLR